MPDNNWVQQQAAAEARQKVFEALSDFLEEHGHSPLRKELAETTGLSLITVRRHIAALIEEGRVSEGAGPRTLHITD